MPGPLVGATCLTCQHPQRKVIEAAILGGKSVTGTAAAFGLKKDALLKHRKNHMLIPTAGAVAGWRPERGETREAALDRVIAAVANGTMRPDVAAQVRIALKEREEAGGPEVTEWRLRDVEGLEELLADLLDALDPFPQALAALGAVLAKHGLAA